MTFREYFGDTNYKTVRLYIDTCTYYEATRVDDDVLVKRVVSYGIAHNESNIFEVCDELNPSIVRKPLKK